MAGAADGADDGNDVTAVADEIEANEGKYPHSVVYSTSLYSNSNNGPEKLDIVTYGERGQAGELAASRKAQPDQKVADLSTKTAPKHTKKPTDPGQMGGGLCVNRMVGVKGLEPSTSRSQTARASQLRHTPVYLQLPYYTKVTCPCLVQNVQTALARPAPGYSTSPAVSRISWLINSYSCAGR